MENHALSTGEYISSRKAPSEGHPSLTEKSSTSRSSCSRINKASPRPGKIAFAFGQGV